MKLNVGTIRSDYDGFDSIARIAEQSYDLRLEPAELDFSNCSLFEANMAAPLYVVVARLRDELNDVSVINLKPALDAILRKNHFLTKFQKNVLIDTNQTTVPFKTFKLQAGEQFYEYLESYMYGKGIPVMSEGLAKRFRQSLFEIFQNAAIHSNQNQEFLHAANIFLKCIALISRLPMRGLVYGKMFVNILEMRR